MFPIWVNDGTTEMPTDPIFYVVAKDGIYLKKSMGHFNTISKVNAISILGECKPSAKLNITKIKRKQFGQILSLFRAVYNKYKAEVNIILHYNPTKQIFKIDIPPQGVTGGSVNYENGLVTHKGYIRIGTIHSHASMSAFHSGTDQGDEESWDGLHITLGKMDQEYFDISCSVMSSKERFIVDPTEYIESVEIVEYEVESYYQTYKYVNGVREELGTTKKLGWNFACKPGELTFPSEWMDQIDKYKPKARHSQFQQFGFSQDDMQAYYKYLSANGGNLSVQKTIFDGGFQVAKGEWSPCAQCPYKDHKSDILMKDILEKLADNDPDLLEILTEVVEEDDIDEIDGNYLESNEDEERSPFYVNDGEGIFKSSSKDCGDIDDPNQDVSLK